MTVLDFIKGTAKRLEDAAKDTTKRVAAKTEAFLQDFTTTVDDLKNQQKNNLAKLRGMLQTLESTYGIKYDSSSVVRKARDLHVQEAEKINNKETKKEEIDIASVEQATKNVETILSLIKEQELINLKEKINNMHGNDQDDLKKYATEEYDKLLGKIYVLEIANKDKLVEETKKLMVIISERQKSIA